jgi:hypothetical protein
VNTRGCITLGELIGKLDRTTVRGGASCRLMKDPPKIINPENRAPNESSSTYSKCIL